MFNVKSIFLSQGPRVLVSQHTKLRRNVLPQLQFISDALPLFSLGAVRAVQTVVSMIYAHHWSYTLWSVDNDVKSECGPIHSSHSKHIGLLRLSLWHPRLFKYILCIRYCADQITVELNSMLGIKGYVAN